jgi:hypothetical protein
MHASQIDPSLSTEIYGYGVENPSLSELEYNKLKKQCFFARTGAEEPSDILKPYLDGSEFDKEIKDSVDYCLTYSREIMKSNLAFQEKLEVAQMYITTGQTILGEKDTTSLSYSEFERISSVLNRTLSEIDSSIAQLNKSPNFDFLGQQVIPDHAFTGGGGAPSTGWAGVTDPYSIFSTPVSIKDREIYEMINKLVEKPSLELLNNAASNEELKSMDSDGLGEVNISTLEKLGLR